MDDLADIPSARRDFELEKGLVTISEVSKQAVSSNLLRWRY